MKDITISGNSLVITDTVTSIIELEVPAKDFYFSNRHLNENILNVYDTHGINESIATEWEGNISDVTIDGVAATASTLRTFQQDHLGKSSTSGGNGVNSVTGDGVGGTASDPVLTFPTPAEIGAKADFTENSAFNKDFGTGSTDVLRGDTTTITPAQSSDITTNNSKVSFPEAPADGNQYARKDNSWEQVASSSGDMEKSVYDPNNVDDDAFDYSNFLGITQMPDDQIISFTKTGGGSVEIDNYDLDVYNVHFINPGAHDRDFTGMIAPPSGVNRIVTIINAGTNKKLKFKDNDSSSSAANRILLADRSDVDLERAGSMQLIYNHDVNRWVTYSYY